MKWWWLHAAKRTLCELQIWWWFHAGNRILCENKFSVSCSIWFLAKLLVGFCSLKLGVLGLCEKFLLRRALFQRISRSVHLCTWRLQLLRMTVTTYFRCFLNLQKQFPQFSCWLAKFSHYIYSPVWSQASKRPMFERLAWTKNEQWLLWF